MCIRPVQYYSSRSRIVFIDYSIVTYSLLDLLSVLILITVVGVVCRRIRYCNVINLNYRRHRQRKQVGCVNVAHTVSPTERPSSVMNHPISITDVQ
jgi:hypothetical protein